MLIDGSQSTTADLKGKVTLVNFWATTCVSCVKEMPALTAPYNKYKDRGYDTVAVAMSFVFGALQTIGVGFYAPCMAMVYAMGMHPKTAFPIMMTATAS